MAPLWLVWEASGSLRFLPVVHQDGKVLRLRGKGLPTVNGYGRGDILVNISVYIPETLSKEEKKSMESFKESDNFKPAESIKEKIFRRFRKLFD